MGKAIVIISWILILISGFLLIIFGAGSHGHIGLWDHKDSFYIYSFIYWSFSLIGILNFIYYNRNIEMRGLRIFISIFVSILIIIGLWMTYLTLYEDSTTHHTDRVGVGNYMSLILPISIQILILIKLNKNRLSYIEK